MGLSGPLILHVEMQLATHTKVFEHGYLKYSNKRKPRGLLALPCRIGEFSCMPPHNEEKKD